MMAQTLPGKIVPAAMPAAVVDTAVLPKAAVIQIPIHQKLAVGAVAGVIGTSCIFPIDTVKTRLQAAQTNAKGELLYRNPSHAFRSIYRAEGVRAFYKGLLPNLVGVTPEKAIKLAVNDIAREYLTDEHGHITAANEALAGATAGFVQVIATNPMEIVKLNMQLQNLRPVAERQTTMEVVRELGLRGMYRGSQATLMRDVPYSLIFFPTYAHMKHELRDKNGQNSMPSIMLAGGIAGASAAILCTPADVVKTRLQAAAFYGKYRGVSHCFTTILREEGAKALFRGWLPRAMVTAPLFGIALLAFELQKNYIRYGTIRAPPSQ